MQLVCGLTSKFPIGNKLGKALAPASVRPKETGAQIGMDAPLRICKL